MVVCSAREHYTTTICLVDASLPGPRLALRLPDDRFIGCAFSFARSRVRAFNGSMFWLGQRAARARLDGGERRGHMQPNTPRRKNARTRERANARTKTRKPQGNARDSIAKCFPAV